MPGSSRRLCAFTLRRADAKGAVFDRGARWIGEVFGLAIATAVGAAWVHGFLRNPHATKYFMAAGILFISVIWVMIFTRLITSFELRTDRVGHSISYRKRRFWGPWRERWTFEASEVRDIRLSGGRVDLGLEDGETYTLDSGDEPETLRVLAAHVGEALQRPVKESGPDA